MTRGRRGQVTITQQADGRWRTDLRLGSDPTTGKPVRVTIRGDTSDDVQAEVVRLQSDQRRGVPTAPERETLAAYLTRWLEDTVRPRRKPSTYQRYRRAVEHHIAPYLGHLRLDRLRPEHVDSLLYTLELEGRLPRHEKEVGRHPPGLAPASVLLVRAVLRRALAVAMRRGRLARNVATLVEPPAFSAREPRPLDDDEARRLLAAARGGPLEGIVAIALGLGLRQAEALGLVWSDVDLDAGVVRVRRQLARVDGAWRLVELKSRASPRRELPLPAVIAAAVRRHQSRQELARRVAGDAWKGAPWPLVFPTGVGTPWSARNLTRAFHVLLGEAGLPPMVWHDLRHSAGSLLHARGVDLATIQAILGHSSIAVTANIYTHVGAATKRAAAEAMHAALDDDRDREERS